MSSSSQASGTVGDARPHQPSDQCGPTSSNARAAGIHNEPAFDSKAAEKWMTVQECADHLKVHRETLLRTVRAGLIPVTRLLGAGRLYRFPRTAIDQWAKDRSLGKRQSK
jgi:excisionase family DNA binding protein